jgi:hypothetical protein
MTISTARETIVRKFTNYRNNFKRNMEDRLTDRHLYDSMKEAASALVDLKTYSKGRNLYKRRNRDVILTKRDEILSETPELTKIGAFQKAMKHLWGSADQGYWEAQGVGEAEDIYE